MKRLLILDSILVVILAFIVVAQEKFETDIIKTSAGNLEITFIGHGTLMFTFGGRVIHVDPWSKMADYTKPPKADIILLTHHHRDHLDVKALDTYRTEKTTVVLTETFAAKVRAEVRRRTEDLAEDGRFVLAAIHNIRPEVWPESICAMDEAALEYGRYRAEKKD